MTVATEHIVNLDRKHRAIRSSNRWAVQKFLPDGSWDTVATWAGGRRSLILWCETNDVAPSREAEQALELFPETADFRERQ